MCAMLLTMLFTMLLRVIYKLHCYVYYVDTCTILLTMCFISAILLTILSRRGILLNILLIILLRALYY